MTDIDRQEYLDFVGKKFSLGKLDEGQTSFLMSQIEPSEMLAALESTNLRTEFQNRKENELREEQNMAFQKTSIIDNINKLEEEIAIEDAKMKPIRVKMEPVLQMYDNTFKRSQMYPDNPRFAHEVEKMADELNVFRDAMIPHRNIIKQKKEELANLRTIVELM